MSVHDLHENDRIIFSLADGVVWASWPGREGSVRLGPEELVIHMMDDFLGQCDLGDRLVDRYG